MRETHMPKTQQKEDLCIQDSTFLQPSVPKGNVQLIAIYSSERIQQLTRITLLKLSHQRAAFSLNVNQSYTPPSWQF